jgi:hypothetical protein
MRENRIAQIQALRNALAAKRNQMLAQKQLSIQKRNARNKPVKHQPKIEEQKKEEPQQVVEEHVQVHIEEPQEVVEEHVQVHIEEPKTDLAPIAVEEVHDVILIPSRHRIQIQLVVDEKPTQTPSALGKVQPEKSTKNKKQIKGKVKQNGKIH